MADMRIVSRDSSPWVSASLSCADLLHLKDAIEELNNSSIDFLHYDVVDGRFNNCFVFGDLVLQKIRPLCDKPIEVHLAVEDVRPYIEPYAKAGADYIAVHYEIADDLNEVFELIRQAGCRPILAFRCDTEVPQDFLMLAQQVDWILKLCVEPGYAGQKMQRCALDHIAKMRKQLKQHGLTTHIQADGNIHTGTIPDVIAHGADILTGGTSGLFKKNQSIEESIAQMKEASR